MPAPISCLAGLMAKGGFMLWANYTPGGGVDSPVRLKSVAGASAVLLNPWPGHNASVVQVAAGSGGTIPAATGVRSVPTTWVQTAAGPALKFDTTAGEDETYIISKVGSKVSAVPLGDRAGHYADVIACPTFSGNCSACVAANDTRKDWASPCVFLSESSSPWANETCQPSKWWAKSADTYPHIHVCASCTQPTSACPAAPPPPEGTCPLMSL